MLALFGSGGYEWIIILIVALLLFGRRLPEVMRSMGQGIRQFKKGLNDVEADIESAGGSEGDAGKLPGGGTTTSTGPWPSTTRSG